MVRIKICVIPNAKNNEIVGYENGAWKIRLSTPSVDGRANEALIEFLAEELDEDHAKRSLKYQIT